MHPSARKIRGFRQSRAVSYHIIRRTPLKNRSPVDSLRPASSTRSPPRSRSSYTRGNHARAPVSEDAGRSYSFALLLGRGVAQVVAGLVGQRLQTLDDLGILLRHVNGLAEVALQVVQREAGLRL